MKAPRWAVLALLPALAGCSQVHALQPVSTREVSVRFAAIDVLLDHGIQLMDAPACTMTNTKDVSCQGTTATGQGISVTSPAPTQVGSAGTMTVTVGHRVVYDGSVSDVLTRHAQPGSGPTS
jgi:hypothetical protein